MRYISTRGQAPALNFEDVLLAGLATDGGLYVPENLPRFTQEEIASWAGLPYHELAFRVMRPFVTGSIPDADFKKILEETYGVFSHAAVAPLRQLNGNEWVLELFHGPTLAFKDFALQLLGRLLDYVLEKRGERVVIVGATSREKAAIPRSASLAMVSLLNGLSMPISTAALLIRANSLSLGATTLRISSAPKASVAFPMVAPAAS